MGASVDGAGEGPKRSSNPACVRASDGSEDGRRLLYHSVVVLDGSARGELRDAIVTASLQLGSELGEEGLTMRAIAGKLACADSGNFSARRAEGAWCGHVLASVLALQGVVEKQRRTFGE